MHKQLVRHQWFSMVIVGVATVLDLPESIKVAQQDVTEPLGVDTGDLPLLGFLILQSTGAGGTRELHRDKSILKHRKAFKHVRKQSFHPIVEDISLS